MDTFAHGLWTYAITRTPKKRIAWFWPVFFSVSPDLFWFIPVGIMIVASRTGLSTYAGDGLFIGLYNISHSLVVWALATLTLSAILRRWFWPTWGWALHIIIDIVGHQYTLTPFLWPLSSMKVHAAWDWLNVPWLIGNYVALAAVFLILRRRRRLTHLP